jgi:hypothetical protein
MSLSIPTGYFDTTGDADAIAATLANVPNYAAAEDAPKAVAVQQASDEINRGMRYQGRRYDPTQNNEFPRVAYDSSKQMALGLGLGPIGPIGPTGPEVFGLGIQIWDWDYTNGGAIVPPWVLQAVIIQADFDLGPANVRAETIHQGVRGQSTGGLREDYDRHADGVRTNLCRRAFMLMQRYRLASGRLI